MLRQVVRQEEVSHVLEYGSVLRHFVRRRHVIRRRHLGPALAPALLPTTCENHGFKSTGGNPRTKNKPKQQTNKQSRCIYSGGFFAHGPIAILWRRPPPGRGLPPCTRSDNGAPPGGRSKITTEIHFPVLILFLTSIFKLNFQFQ